MVWKCFVLPGVDDTLTFFSPRRALIVLDFPTFGYPTRPTTAFGGGFPLASVNSRRKITIVDLYEEILRTHQKGLVHVG